jgi:AraC family transcriptional regulator, regulatory protein of adaptative response / methylated-DNA-[protein]-cysteine methyltransferase
VRRTAVVDRVELLEAEDSAAPRAEMRRRCAAHASQAQNDRIERFHGGFDNEIRIDVFVAMPHNRPMIAVAQDPRLAAVMTRDRRADGAFVYGVRSTRIFCRPSCSARRPSADRISLFTSPREAREAGFRACLRCQPEAVANSDATLAQRICRYIDASEDGAPSLIELADVFGFSPHHLARSFKATVGLTPKAYAGLQRLEKLKARLRKGEQVTEALYEVGFGSSSRLYEDGNRLLGMTPNDYRRGGRGALIRYTVVDSWLGKVLAAASARGICAVNLGGSEPSLERELRREYSSATIVRDDAALGPAVAHIIRCIERGERLREFELDVAATAFTRSVWKALAAIPPGQTRTYGEIARAIGHPRAARAVARACAANKIALIIPCHRAVPQSGNTGGYRWGAARKRALLKRERELGCKDVDPN